jgi:uncharacterized protein (TIGR00730 family)
MTIATIYILYVPFSQTRVSQLRSITVYCSSSRHVAPVYFDAARELGRGIAGCGWTLVYGGNNLGLMDAVASAVRGAGGKVVGITPQMMADQNIVDRQCDELIVTATMRERKALLEERGDAFIALPGGIGTFEEWFEVLVGRTLGYHDKPLVLLNINGYYDPLLAMMEHGIEQNFIRPRVREAYFVARVPGQAIDYLRAGEVVSVPREPSSLE